MRKIILGLALALPYACAMPAKAQVDPRAAPIKEALAMANGPYYLGPSGNGDRPR